MTFRLKIECDNVAFHEDPQELSHCLGRVACAITNPLALALGEDSCFHQDGFSGTVQDINGNTVGQWTLKEE